MRERFDRQLKQQTSLSALQRQGMWLRRVAGMRSEQEIFDELATLCASPGYAHAVAFLCWRDNMISYSVQMKAECCRRR